MFSRPPAAKISLQGTALPILASLCCSVRIQFTKDWAMKQGVQYIILTQGNLKPEALHLEFLTAQGSREGMLHCLFLQYKRRCRFCFATTQRASEDKEACCQLEEANPSSLRSYRSFQLHRSNFLCCCFGI